MAKRKPKKRGRPSKKDIAKHEREQQRKLERDRKTAGWTVDLSWKSKPPPPEVIYMIIGGKPVRCRLTHMHNMPVYLPDIEELP